MKHLIRTLLASLFICLYSCNTYKPLSQKEINSLKKQGYVLGTLEKKNAGDCEWTLTDEDSGLQYDPVNFEMDKFPIDKKLKKQIVLVKFLPLRMKNRCGKASPVSIIEIVENKKDKK